MPIMRLDASNFERRVIASDVAVLVLLTFPNVSDSPRILEVYREAKGWMADAVAKRRLLAGKVNTWREPFVVQLRNFRRPGGQWEYPYLLLYRPGHEPEGFRLWGVIRAGEREFIEWHQSRQSVA